MRNKAIETIKEFMENWRVEAKKYYMDAKATYIKKGDDIAKQRESEYTLSKEEKLAQVLKPDKPKSSFTRRDFEKGGYKTTYTYHESRSDEMGTEKTNWLEETFSQAMQSEIRYYHKDFEKRLDKILDKEVARKTENLIKRIEKKGGKMVDVNTLNIGDNGELNGIIKCENKMIEISTIFAGGYNIQVLHFRTLVKVRK